MGSRVNYISVIIYIELFFTSGITPYTTNTNTSFNIGKNTSEVIVVIKHAEATNLISNL